MIQEQKNSGELLMAEKEVKGDNAAGLLQESTAKLIKFGGFKVLENAIKGVQNLNPDSKARKKIFLTDVSKKAERETLKETLKLWIGIVTESDKVSDMIAKSEEKAETARKTLKHNLKKSLEASKELEESYRSVALFYKNTESDKIKNVTILNADPEQLKDLDNPVFIDKVAEELKNNFDRLDLRDSYSLLVIPGYLGSNMVVEKWAKIAHTNKVMLVTDFENLENPDGVLDFFQAANLTGGDGYRANVMMACNWLVGRGKDSSVGEEEDVYVAPSSALAGRVYSTLMSQVTAGKKHGGLSEVDGVRFKLKKSELTNLEKIGLIPMVKEYEKVMAFSAKTLFNGDNLGLQTYSVVRVFDYVMKVLMDFLNRRAFENFNINTKRDLQYQIEKFLDNITGPGNLIEKFKIMRFEQDPKQKDRIFLDIHMTPYFPAKNFLIKLDGQKGDDPDSSQWTSACEQQ